MLAAGKPAKCHGLQIGGITFLTPAVPEPGNGFFYLVEYCLIFPADVHCPPGTECVAGVCESSCLADLDNDGNVGTSDLLIVLAAWGSDPGGPPDFDCDGVVGTADLLFLLANWGPC